jgi:hypothetical protein
MSRVCSQCGTPLNQYHSGNLCFPCQEKKLREEIASGEDIIDAEGLASILGLTNAESVKRLAIKGKLPPRIPVVKKYQWRKSVIEEWLKQEGQTGNRDLRMTARGIASNLRKCRYDPVICHTLSDKIGAKVYGTEFVIGTGYGWRTEPIELVKVDRDVALKALERLPKEEFPELNGVTDWADLTYEIISETFIARLESYF